MKKKKLYCAHENFKTSIKSWINTNSLDPDRKKYHLELEMFLLVLECTLGIEVSGK